MTPDYVPMLGEFATEAALQSYEHLERAHLERAQDAVDRSVAILRTAGCELEPMLRRGGTPDLGSPFLAVLCDRCSLVREAG